MFRQYRKIERGEWFIVGGDCSQGGSDFNSCSFLSATKLDFPLEYHAQGVASIMTDAVYPVFNKIHDLTGLPPLVAFETNNGGGSEMERLNALNRLSKYRLYKMKKYGTDTSDNTTQTWGFVTSSATRPILLGDYKKAFDSKVFKIYYETSINEHFTFVINKSGKPEHARNKHDDTIFGKAIAWQLYQTESMPVTQTTDLPQNDFSKWRIGRK